MKPTLVIGASENPERYSYKAIRMLRQHGHPVFAYGNKVGKVEDVDITNEPLIFSPDTVTMYVGPQNQTDELKNYILAQNPKRIIFNPGTENPNWYPELEDKGIAYEEACTLVLLSTDSY